MREIKFRAWTEDRGMIVPPFNLFIKDHMTMLMQEGGYFGYNGSSITLMQYTGLKDKNGVEIYEGDVLGDGAIVEWFDNLAWDSGGSLHPGFYCKMWANYESDDTTTELSYHWGFDDCEVIGNIYTNPELLK